MSSSALWNPARGRPSLRDPPGGGPPGAGAAADAIRLEVLLVRDSDPPHIFAERFPLGSAEAPDRERLARLVADRIALSLRQP